MKFNPGDRVIIIQMPEFTGIITEIKQNMLRMRLDSPASGINKNTNKYSYVTDGWVSEDEIELIKKSDWEEIWNSDD